MKVQLKVSRPGIWFTCTVSIVVVNHKCVDICPTMDTTPFSCSVSCLCGVDETYKGSSLGSIWQQESQHKLVNHNLFVPFELKFWSLLDNKNSFTETREQSCQDMSQNRKTLSQRHQCHSIPPRMIPFRLITLRNATVCMLLFLFYWNFYEHAFPMM